MRPASDRYCLMNEAQRAMCRHLAAMSSSDAATWLMETFPLEREGWGEALVLMPHRSWKRADQLRLARYYLSRIPFAGPRGYEAFLSFMSVPRMLAVLKEHLPADPDRRSLLAYYLGPLLARRTAGSAADSAAAQEFLAQLW